MRDEVKVINDYNGENYPPLQSMLHITARFVDKILHVLSIPTGSMGESNENVEGFGDGESRKQGSYLEVG